MLYYTVIDNIKYFKVMKYSNTNADILYAALSEQDGSYGNAEKFYWPIYSIAPYILPIDKYY